jgi:hypothetical protein
VSRLPKMFCHMEPYSKNKIVFNDDLSVKYKRQNCVKVEINVFRMICFSVSVLLTLWSCHLVTMSYSGNSDSPYKIELQPEHM